MTPLNLVQALCATIFLTTYAVGMFWLGPMVSQAITFAALLLGGVSQYIGQGREARSKEMSVMFAYAAFTLMILALIGFVISA